MDHEARPLVAWVVFLLGIGTAMAVVPKIFDGEPSVLKVFCALFVGFVMLVFVGACYAWGSKP